ncbi:phosphatidylglycerophosphatase A [Comamonadaceae bacterium OH2310_COT-174]|uniref:Phosphatidylglycerophosphatase A n=2 Tax=Vandammella animalimorsus TaxID=2029117 RepID=A0A2A2A8Q8_9BURK|nr:phosphatidylglycerophosphatase A [Vandammella animalimorsus]RRD65094.1 phosphatidylglycerophosphatase A [Comamonadaceae bacterium OH2310_COT-174]
MEHQQSGQHLPLPSVAHAFAIQSIVMSSTSRTTSVFPLGDKLSARLARAIALGLGCGRIPVSPGTMGTLAAWLSYALLLARAPDALLAWFFVAALLIGWWACERTARMLGSEDPGCIVWDEILAFWLVLWVLGPSSFWLQLLAFGLFRFFDIVKPQPVRWADRAFKGHGWRGAWGILWDDLVAAFCTLLVLALGVHWF